MRKIFLFIFAFLFIFTNLFAQNSPSYEYPSHTGKVNIIRSGVQYESPTYSSNVTDTSINIKTGVLYDSTGLAFSSNDTSYVYFYLIYGDGEKSRVLSSIVIDSVKSSPTSGGVYKYISWQNIVKAAGGQPFFPSFRIVLIFQSSGNDTQGTANYSLWHIHYPANKTKL
jgi:hypothetical protein